MGGIRVTMYIKIGSHDNVLDISGGRLQQGEPVVGGYQLRLQIQALAHAAAVPAGPRDSAPPPWEMHLTGADVKVSFAGTEHFLANFRTIDDRPIRAPTGRADQLTITCAAEFDRSRLAALEDLRNGRDLRFTFALRG